MDMEEKVSLQVVEGTEQGMDGEGGFLEEQEKITDTEKFFGKGYLTAFDFFLMLSPLDIVLMWRVQGQGKPCNSY